MLRIVHSFILHLQNAKLLEFIHVILIVRYTFIKNPNLIANNQSCFNLFNTQDTLLAQLVLVDDEGGYQAQHISHLLAQLSEPSDIDALVKLTTNKLSAIPTRVSRKLFCSSLALSLFDPLHYKDFLRPRSTTPEVERVTLIPYDHLPLAALSRRGVVPSQLEISSSLPPISSVRFALEENGSPTASEMMGGYPASPARSIGEHISPVVSTPFPAHTEAFPLHLLLPLFFPENPLFVSLF